jgi:hypothetical protein
MPHTSHSGLRHSIRAPGARAEALPADLVTLSTSRSPDKGSIKERIKAAIAKAIAGLPQEQAAPLAFSIAATAVPGARLLKRRHWSIH